MVRAFLMVLVLIALFLTEGVNSASARTENPAPPAPGPFGTTSIDVLRPSFFSIDLPESYDWQQVVSAPSNAMFGVEVSPSLTLVATVIWYFLDPNEGLAASGNDVLDAFIGARLAVHKGVGQSVETSALIAAATRNFSDGLCQGYTSIISDRLEPRGSGSDYSVRLDGMACVHPAGDGIVLLEFSERYPKSVSCDAEFRKIGDDFFTSLRFAEY